MPPVSRQKPIYLQIADQYEGMITSGELAHGAQLPTVREIAEQTGASHQTVVRAMDLLRSAKLIVTHPNTGSFVAEPRQVQGPQQWLTATDYPASETVTVLSAELASAPAYIAPVLDLLEVKPGFWPVIRREQVHYDATGLPFLLKVSWFPPEFAEPIPELVTAVPLAGMGSAVHLIAQRTGRLVTHGKQSREARQILADGREGPLLGLPEGYVVLAETYWWRDARGIMEYGEYIMTQNRVTVNEFEI